MRVSILEADLDDSDHTSALVHLIDSYARGPNAQGAPLSDEARDNLIKGLKEHPCALVLLALVEEQVAGVAVCVWGFSTFAGRASINIHDFTVLPEHQGRGIGTRLLGEIECRARERGCCKITLEVNDSNEGAKRLYERVGFGPWQPATLFVSKRL